MTQSQFCDKCKGTGQFVATYGNRAGKPIGDCFACRGTGMRTALRNEPEPRSAVAAPANHCFPKIIKLVTERNIKLFLGTCKITAFQNGSIALVSPVFGHGIYGHFNKKTGEFSPNKSCSPEHIQILERVESEGLKAVQAIGILTGTCCVCGRTLTNDSSITDGIGPICSGKIEGAW